MAAVVIFGATETSLLFQYLINNDSPHSVAAFTVDGALLRETTLGGVPVVPFEDLPKAFPPSDFSAAAPLGFTGVNQLRAEKSAALVERGYSLISYVSSRASVWPDLRVGANTYIQEGAIIQPYARIGSNVMIGVAAIVGHHSIVDDHCFIGPAATLMGGVAVRSFAVVGGNATVRDGVEVGSGAIVGAGSLVTQHVKSGSVVLAMPSERLDGDDVDAGSFLRPVSTVGGAR